MDHHVLTEAECWELDPHYEEYVTPDMVALGPVCRRCMCFCEGCNEGICVNHYNEKQEFCNDCCALLLSKSPRELVSVRDTEGPPYHPTDDPDRWSRGRTALELVQLSRVPGQRKLTHFYKLVDS